MEALSGTDALAVMNSRNNYGYGYGMDGMNGWFWIIILLFFGRGNWGYGNGYGESPLVSEEFIKRDIFNTNQNVSTTSCQTQRDVLENRYTNQLCCCNMQKEILENRYNTSLGLANVQKDILLGNQNLQSQMAQCCCDLRAAIHAEGEATRGLIQANTIQDLRDKVNERDRELQSAQFQISQVAQTNNIISSLAPKTPIPAYLTCSPYTSYGNCGFGCGCNGNVNI